MIWPSETFDVAMIVTAASLGNVPNGGDVAKMLDSGHPLNAGFELVKYSQAQLGIASIRQKSLRIRR